MAAGQEIMGSRVSNDASKQKSGTMLFVSDDGTTGVPVVGTTFFTPAGGSVESGLTGRVCITVTVQPEVLPGVYYHVAQFVAFKAYA